MLHFARLKIKISTGPGLLILQRQLRFLAVVIKIIWHLSCDKLDLSSHISGGLQGNSGVFSVRCYGKLLLALSGRTLPPHPPCANILPQQTLHDLPADRMG